MQNKLDFYIHLSGKLKELQRTGWIRKGIANAETVAAHSHGVSLLVLLFAPDYLDKEKCLKLAVIHDLQEVIVGDITPFDGVTSEEKGQREQKAVQEIAQKLGFDELKELFAEYETNQSAEARFVRDMDRLDAVLQAKYYDDNKRTKEKIFAEFYNYALSHTNKDEAVTAELFATVKKL